jgi:hypothetical protein
MRRRLMKIAGMASSSKRRRTSSSKKSGADDTRVISVKRADMLPRTGVASAGRRKPMAEPSLDSATEPPAKAVAASKKSVQRRDQTETVGSRARAPRPADRTSGKPKKAAAKEVKRAAPEMPAVWQPVTETVGAVEPATTANNESAMTVLELPAEGALAAVETEMVVEPSAILEETTIALPVAPLPHSGTRGFVRTVLRLLSTLRRWTGPRL